MTTIYTHKENIKNIQIESIHKTLDILRMINDSQNNGAKSVELLDKQYEQLGKINNTHDTINENLDKSSTILGKIKYLFFPRKVTKIEITNNIPIDTNDTSNTNNSNNLNNFNTNKSISINSIKPNEFIDKTLEEQIDENIDKINIGVANLKNIASDMNFALDRDKELLDKINNKSEIVTTNIKKINKEINKLL